MKKYFFAAMTLCLLSGCGEVPPPVGPAAEAPTADIEITIDSPTATVSTPNEELAKLEFSVPAMACEINCPPAVRKTLEDLPGVARVEVDFNTKTATCQVDQSKFDTNGAIASLAAVGFKDSRIKD